MLTTRDLREGWAAGWVEEAEDGIWWLAALKHGTDISDIERMSAKEAQDALFALIDDDLSRAMDADRNPLWRDHIRDEDDTRIVSMSDGSEVRIRKAIGRDLMKVRGRTLFDRELTIVVRLTHQTMKDVLSWNIADYMVVQGAMDDFLGV